jgi:nicotinate-nucleotide adenylyltransferase
MFGGTFDPPHVAHLALAERAREQLGLDRVVFVPAARPPHKPAESVSDADVRLAMTRLAVQGNPAFRVSRYELLRGGTSFTVDTLRALKRAHPRARLYLLIGADSLADFHTWREPDLIRRLATLVVAGRPGARSAGAGRGRRFVRLGGPALDVSSSEIRARLRRGLSVRYLVPDAVVRYATRRRVYGRPRRAGGSR